MTLKDIKTLKDQEALLDYYYDELPESERYTFLMQLLENPPEFEFEIHEMFLDSPEYNKSNYDAIAAFATKYNELQPEEYSRTYEFIELELTTTAFFLKDKEQINRSLSVLKGNPVTGIDTVVKQMLFQLIFNGYYQEAIDFSEAVWKPLAESEKLWGYPEYDFAYTIYLSRLEKQYELLQSGNTSGLFEFQEIIKELGFDNSEERMDPVFSILSMQSIDNLKLGNLPDKKEERLFIINIHFLIYMKKTYNVPFILSEWWFNLLHGKDLFNKRKEPGAELFIPYKVLDKYITSKLDTLLGSNYFEMFGKVWGLHYVYEFFYKVSLISEPWYSKMAENIALLKKEFIAVIGRDIWQMHFISSWPGEDIPGNLKLTEDFFIKSFEQRKVQNESYFDRSRGQKEENIFSQAPHYLDEEPYKPYQKEGNEPGRNDPCPCGSGKKYKKCCMK